MLSKETLKTSMIQERQTTQSCFNLVGVIAGPSSVTNCSCVATNLCLTEDIINQGEGVINPRHACSDNNVCCIHPLTTPLNPAACGVSNPRGPQLGALATRITTNATAVLGEFPWMVAILETTDEGNLFACGGSLVDPRVVLTAAHCVDGVDAGDLLARVGEWDASVSTGSYPSKDISVTRTILHPDYRAADLCNDVALLILADPADTTQPHIGLSCLPAPADTYLVDQCVVTGWGKQRFQDNSFSSVLRKLTVPIVEFTACQDMMQGTQLGTRFRLDTSFLCAGSVST